MTPRQFYNKRLAEDNTIGSVQLMEEYVKHIINLNFCDGSPIDFEKCKIEELKTIHDKVNTLVDYANS